MDSVKTFVLKLNPVTEKFTEKQNFSSSDLSITLWVIIQYVIFLGALYFAFKCKTANGGIRWGQVLLAVFLAPFYLVYRLAVPCA